VAFDQTTRDAESGPETGLDRSTSVAVLIGVTAAVIAGAAIWLVLTDPVTVANALDSGEVTPLVRRLAEVLYQALAGLLDYL
jgi:LPXTG-motif cell wall-anchored protein